MPLYHFRYVDSDGITHTGDTETDSREALVHELQTKGTVLEVSEAVKSVARAGPTLPRPGFLNPRLTPEDLAIYTRQMGTMLTAGLPMMKVLALLRKRCPNRRFAEILEDVSKSMQGGQRLSDSLGKHPEVFEPIYLSLVKVGETSGQMAAMVDRLGELLEKDVAMRRRVNSAMAYPSFILMFTVLLSWGMLVFLMPLFAPMFKGSDLNIPRDYPMTHLLMKLSDLTNNPVGIVASILLLYAGAYTLKALGRSRPGRKMLDQLQLRIPIVNSLVRYSVTARIARTLSTLIHSGMPMMQALSLLTGIAGNEVYREALERISQQISKGKRMSDAIEMEAAIFPDMLIQMIQVGEESGALGQMLERAADYFDAQVEQAIHRLLSFLEPAMMVGVGSIVCGFVMAVLLPILGLAQAK